MDVLSALGVDSTLGIQFLIFLFTYIFLFFFLFKPYHRIYEQRMQRTQGNTEMADQIVEQVRQWEQEYEEKARALNNETKIIFDQERLEAMREHDRIINQAREKLKSILDKNGAQIQREFEIAKIEITKEVPRLSVAITDKLLGHDKEAKI